jgi:hypothetical protein
LVLPRLHLKRYRSNQQKRRYQIKKLLLPPLSLRDIAATNKSVVTREKICCFHAFAQRDITAINRSVVTR